MTHEIRYLTSGPREPLTPHYCAAEIVEPIAVGYDANGSRQKTDVAGRVWTWSPIQLVWTSPVD